MKNITILLSFSVLGLTLADEVSFAKHDGDKNGEVTYKEFATVQKVQFDALDRDRSKSLTMQEALKAEPVGEFDLFALPPVKEIDTDGNEVIALAEFGAAVKGVFEKLDTIESSAANGAIAKTEYLAAVSKAKTAAAKAAAASAPAKGSAAKAKGSAPKTP